MKTIKLVAILLSSFILASNVALAEKPEGVGKDGKHASKHEMKDKQHKREMDEDHAEDDDDRDTEEKNKKDKSKKDANKNGNEKDHDDDEESESKTKKDKLKKGAEKKGNDTSAEMQQRRDERKAIMDEHKVKGKKEGDEMKGKKPWWKFGSSDE